MAYRSSQNTRKRSTRRNDSEFTETSRTSRSRSARSSRALDDAYDYVEDPDGYDDEEPGQSASKRSPRETAREERRRRRTKERADKMFDRQMAERLSGSDAQAEGAPRAALYEGQMGSSQRKAARMQRSSEAGPVSAKLNPAGWFSNISVNPRLLGIATAAICLVLVGVFLYTPAQQYYQAQRDRDRLAAEYAVIAERNNMLDEQNDSLASDAGLEDAIRQKYGYISPDEQMAVVTGLDAEETAAARSATDVEGNVLASSVKAPEEWYTPILDAFFGVK